MEAYAQLLGAPKVRLADVWHDLPLTKANALLFYLAYKGEWCSRDELLFLFYPDAPETVARTNLRQRLSVVRHSPYSDGLEIEANRLRWPVATDVQAFKQAVSEGQWVEAVKLYSGRFLEGLSVSDAPEFESWLEAEREELHSQWRDAVLALAKSLEASGRYPQACEVLETLYKTDLLDEEILQCYLQALYLNGQRSSALEVFERFKRQLREEYDGEPEDETLQLIERIEQNKQELQPAIPPSRALEVKQETRHNLPAQPTPFVGREEEREKLAQLLSDPTCRLVTLVGPGGMGKTRLALEVAREQLDYFKDGVYFVNMVPVASPDLMVYAIGQAIGFSFFGQQEPKEQLLDYIRDKKMLLVLDNLEHLLSGIHLVSDILERAPDLKLMATSRLRLDLRAEQAYDLRGLGVPDEGPQEAQDYDAVKLFIQRAGSVRADFIPDETNSPIIIHICQLVRGLPLAIELAASWLRALPVEDIATEIERGIDVLEASTRDLPERHRSVRAVFDYSWRLLTNEEQAVLRKLSACQGGFRREAAAEIAGATLPVLASLVDKSFLTLTPTGRYRRHPLVLQYTKERLSEHPEEIAQVREKHCLHYLLFVQERVDELFTSKGKYALEATRQELSNIRTAWTWLIENERVDEIKTYVLVLDRLFRYRVPEAVTLYAQAIEALDSTNPDHQVALGYVLAVQSFHILGLARFEEAYQCAQRSIDLLEPLGGTQGIMIAQLTLGIELYMAGDMPQAKVKLGKSHALSRKHPETLHTGFILFYLALVERNLSTFPQVRRFFEEAIAETEPLHDLEGLAILKQQYGLYLAQHAMMEEGEKFSLEGLKLIRKSNSPGLECTMLASVAVVVSKLGKYQEAEAFGLEAVAIAEKLHMKHMVAMALTRLGEIALAQGKYPEAHRYLQEGLQKSWGTQYLFLVLDALALFSKLAIAQGKPTEAAERLGLVQQQPAFSYRQKLVTEELLESLREQLSPQELQEALERGKQMKLEEVVQELLATQ